jgi:hypothetical protein
MTYIAPADVEKVAIVKVGNGARIGGLIAIVTLILQLAALIWGAATLSSRVGFLESTTSAGRATDVELMHKIDQMSRDLGRIEVKVENIEMHLENSGQL